MEELFIVLIHLTSYNSYTILFVLSCPFGSYSMLDIEMLAKFLAYVSVHDIHFISRQITFHVPINYTKTKTAPFGLRMHESIDDFHLNARK